MKAALLTLATLLVACKTTRDTVHVMDPQDPAQPVNPDIPRVTDSIKTNLKIAAISLPTQTRDYERLDLLLRFEGGTKEQYRSQNYKVGDTVPIEAHQRYEIILGAWSGGTEMYSTRFCSQKQTFLAEDGLNTFTAALCPKP